MTDFEREDMELAAIMGGRFHDETAKKPTVEDVEAGIARCYEKAFGSKKTVQKPATKPSSKVETVEPTKDTTAKEKPVEAHWEPVKDTHDFMDKLKQTTKDTCMYAVLSLILFWWQQTGRIDYNTAWYALLVCVGMVFFSIGKNCRGGVS